MTEIRATTQKTPLNYPEIERIDSLADWHIHELMNTIWTQTSGDIRNIRRIYKIFDNLLERKRQLEFLEVLQVLFTLSGLDYPIPYQELGKQPEARAILIDGIVEKMDNRILDFQGVE